MLEYYHQLILRISHYPDSKIYQSWDNSFQIQYTNNKQHKILLPFLNSINLIGFVKGCHYFINYLAIIIFTFKTAELAVRSTIFPIYMALKILWKERQWQQYYYRNFPIIPLYLNIMIVIILLLWCIFALLFQN